MKAIDGAKLLEWLDTSYGKETLPYLYPELNTHIESGTFDLTSTDVDVKEIESFMDELDKDEYFGATLARMYFGKLLTKLAEKEAEAKGASDYAWKKREQFYKAIRERDETQEKLNQAVEALDRIQFDSEDEITRQFAAKTLQSIKGEEPNAGD